MTAHHETGSAQWNDEMYAKHPTPYENGLAGFIQSRRVARVLEYASIGPRDRVLEIGCERGRLCAAVPPCLRLVGCDISAKALEDARNHFVAVGRGAEFQVVDALETLPFEKGEFDVVICSEMLEHVTDPALVIANIADICTTNTRLILTVPVEAPKLLAKRWLERVGLLRLLFPGIEGNQSEWHLQAFSRALLQQLTEPAFICDSVSTVWGCHIVGRFHRKGDGGYRRQLSVL